MSVNTMNFEQEAAFLTALYEEATGQKPAIQIANTADFVSVGTSLIQGSLDPVIGGLVQILDRTLFSMRVYGLGSDGSVSSVKNTIKILKKY